MDKARKTRKLSIRMTEEAYLLLRALSEKGVRPMTSEIELAIRERAENQKIKVGDPGRPPR